MTEHFTDNSLQETPQDEPDVMALLKKIQLQLVYLEKKIDTLINNPPQSGSSFRGAERGDRFSRPHRPFSGGRPDHRRHQGPRGEAPRRFDRPAPSDHPVRGGFDKPSYSARPDRGGFDKFQGGVERGSFPKKKKPFYRKD